MRLWGRIENIYSGEVWLLNGSPRQLRGQVALLFALLRSPTPEDLEAILDLGSQQSFTVEVIRDRPW